MTLVAITTSRRKAEVVTDSLMVADDRTIEPAIDGMPGLPDRKVLHHPSVSAATTSSGVVAAGLAWDRLFADTAAQTGSFDETVATIDPVTLGRPDDDLLILYAVGWSAEAKRFLGYAWGPHTDWQAVRLAPMHLQPHPFGIRREDDLTDRIFTWGRRNDPHLPWDSLVLPDGPPRQAPKSTREWRDIVELIRETRAVRAPDLRMLNPIGGTVRRLTLTADGTARTDLITVLDHDDLPPSEDFKWMLHWHRVRHDDNPPAPSYDDPAEVTA